MIPKFLKKTCTHVLLLFSFHFTFSQPEIKTINTFYASGEVYEAYQANAQDSVKNGTYKRFTKTGKITTIGEYKDGMRNSIWTFLIYDSPRDTAKLYEKYDFTNKKEIFYHRATHDSLPHFPGGYEEMSHFIRDLTLAMKLSLDTIKAYDGKKLLISFKVRPNGKLDDVGIKSSQNEVKSKYLIDFYTEVLKRCPDWIPAETPSVKSMFYTIPINFRGK